MVGDNRLPKIRLSFLSILGKIAGVKEMEAETGSDITLETLLKDLGKRLSAEFRDKVLSQESGINPFVLVLVNGVDTRNDGGVKKTLNDGDQVEFLPAIAGG